MPREKTAERAASMRLLTEIAVKMFAEQPVWQTAAFDEEISRRWTKRTKETPADYDRLKSGRNRFLNLVDWVKANFTRSQTTTTLTFSGSEYRILTNRVGAVHGEALVSVDHMLRVLQTLAKHLSE